ncbi:unnamed protein product [Linum tenue]|uniref:Uncharacterized protein n=1 Tax=Linum tenue TaxID=586396 RepID=A0AAV0H6L1_9ROSI|nr:unnamed protein product [Linum tenue]
MGFVGGRGGGMGGGGGGNMMKAMGRAVTRAGVAGLQDPISPTSASASNSPTPAGSAASSSSSTCSRQAHKSAASGAGPGLHVSPNPVALPISWTTSAFYGSPFDEYGRDWEWVSADGSSSCSSDEKGVIYGLADDFFALGPPPSADEVHTAVNELSQFVGSGRYTSLVHDRYGNEMMKVGMEDEIWWRPLPNLAGSESDWDWKEPSPNLTRMSHPYGTDTVYRAFHLLQNDQSVQRMVTSISSDAAIWDAVMNNEVVRELRHAYYPGREVNSNMNSMSQESTSDETGDKDGVGASENVVEWILDNAKARVVELMESIAELMNKLFAHRVEEVHAGGIGERASVAFEGKVATSLLLSVLVLLVVVLSRAQKA